MGDLHLCVVRKQEELQSALMDPEFLGLLHLCLVVLPFAILFSGFMAWVLCKSAKMGDEQLGYKEGGP